MSEPGFYYLATGKKSGRANGGQEQGPVSVATLQKLWGKKLIFGETMVWGPDMGVHWAAISETADEIKSKITGLPLGIDTTIDGNAGTVCIDSANEIPGVGLQDDHKLQQAQAQVLLQRQQLEEELYALQKEMEIQAEAEANIGRERNTDTESGKSIDMGVRNAETLKEREREETKQLVRDIVSEYAPERISKIEHALEAYSGRESYLLAKVRSRFLKIRPEPKSQNKARAKNARMRGGSRIGTFGTGSRFAPTKPASSLEIGPGAYGTTNTILMPMNMRTRVPRRP